MTKMIRFLSVSMAITLLFFTACTKEQRDTTDTLQQQRIEQVNQRLAPGSYELSPGVVLAGQEASIQAPDEITGGVTERGPNNCTVTINVVLGSGSTLLVDGVGTFTGPQNVNVSFVSANAQSYLVAYGGTTGVTITQLNTGGCVVFNVAPSGTYKVVSGSFKLYCASNLCFEDLLFTPWIPFS